MRTAMVSLSVLSLAALLMAAFGALSITKARDVPGYATAQISDAASEPPRATGRERSPISRDTTAIEHLRTPGVITPGSRYTNVTAGTTCSTGWIIHNGDGPRIMLTAGHCGQAGDRISVAAADGLELYGGEFLYSEVTEGRADIAAIVLTPGVRAIGTPHGQGPPARIATATWLETNRPRICRLGAQTGLSCGDFLGANRADNTVYFDSIVDHGDSGGPVFAQLDDGTTVAVGVANAYAGDDATRTSATLIGPNVPSHFALVR